MKSDEALVDGGAMTSRFDNPKWARKYPLQGPPNILYITDQDNNVMRMMDLSSLQTSQVAGIGARGYVDGPSAPAVLHQPAGLVLHEPPSASGNLQILLLCSASTILASH